MRTPIDRRDALALAVLSLIGVGIPLWLAAAAGTIGLPTIDDWVYMRGASSYFHTGDINIPGHAAAAVGQLLMVQPLLLLSGGDPWAFTAFGLIMTSLGVVATYLLARRFLGIGSAVMAVSVVLAFPGFARLSASFMTDVPCYAFAVLCLYFGVIWLERGTRLALLASICMGLVAVSIREFAVAAPASVLALSWLRNARTERALLTLTSGLFAVGVLLVSIVATTGLGRVTAAPDPSQLIWVGSVFVVLAATLLPAVALRSGQWLPKVTPSQVILGAAVALIAAAIPWGAHGANLWMQNGLEGDALLNGIRGTVFPAEAWLLSGQIGTLAAIALTTIAVSWMQQNLAKVRSWSSAVATVGRLGRDANALLGVFLLAYAAELVAFAPISIYDRYLIPVIPAAAILILSSRAPLKFQFDRALAFSHASFVWLAVSALAIAANSFAFDAARWDQGETAVAMGYDAQTVDAGYEWVGFHAVGEQVTEGNHFRLTWYDNLLLQVPPCIVVANSRPVGPQWKLLRVARPAYLAFLVVGPRESLYVYGADVPECPPLPRLPRGHH